MRPLFRERGREGRGRARAGNLGQKDLLTLSVTVRPGA